MSESHFFFGQSPAIFIRPSSTSNRWLDDCRIFRRAPSGREMAPNRNFDTAGARLRPVSFEQRPGHFDQPQRFGALGHQQVAHVAVQPRHEGLPRETPRQHAVEGHQRIDIVAREQHLRDAEVGVVVQDVERLGDVAVSSALPQNDTALSNIDRASRIPPRRLSGQ